VSTAPLTGGGLLPTERRTGDSPSVQPAVSVCVGGGWCLGVCEECGSTEFYAVKVGVGSRERVDYVPLTRRYSGRVAFEVRAIACKNCGLVQHLVEDEWIVRSRRDIKEFFYKNLPPTRDKGRIMQLLYRYLDQINFRERFRGRNIKHVFNVIVSELGIEEVFRCRIS